MPEMAVPDRPDDAAPAAEERHTARKEPVLGALGTLRILVVGAIVVPLLLAVIGGYLSYRSSYRQATSALAEAVAVAEENTAKILDTHVLVAARVDDLLAGLSDDEIRAQEKALHERMAQQIDGLPQVAAAWAIDAGGRALVSARVYPVNRDLDHSGREDFRALQANGMQTFIWALRARSLERGDFQPYFTVSRRRQAGEGPFRGVVVVAVAGDYFASFYNALLGSSAQYAASVLREDGSALARYPETATSPFAGEHDELLAQAIADRGRGGIIASGSPFSESGSVVAYKRLANYPVYVAVGRTQASILSEWLWSMLGYAAIGVPAAVGFMLLSLMALRRTRREQAALAQARDAVAQRAAIEAQLHQAQKMEAVGLLTAGIAHDFNNLLTIVAGNIALLRADLQPSDARRHRLIAAANSACDRAAALTKRLLSFARREPVDPQPVDVNEVIAGLSDLPWRTLGDKIAANFRLPGGMWPVLVDANQLENALVNLALNARDAMGGRGTLMIETANCRLDEAHAAAHPAAAVGEHGAISVRDTGAGMPKEVRERAFDPFFTTKGVGKGTGLGLSQVYGFVTRFGGHCTIDSEPGSGTTVTLYLPRFAGANGESAKPAAARAGEAAHGRVPQAVANDGVEPR